MLKIRSILALLLFSALPAASQTPTVVTGTIKDANGLPYSFASVQAQLVGIPPNVTATVLVNGIPTQIGGQENSALDVNGNFSMNLFCNSAGGGCSVISPSGTQWQITVNGTGVSPPLGTGPQKCTATLTISGSSQSISSSFSSCPALSNVSTTPTPGVFNSNFDPPLFQCYSAATGCQAQFTTATTGATIDLRGNSIDTHTIRWSLGSNGLVTSVTDTFPYANGDLHTANANWVYQTGTFTVSSNLAYGQSNPGFTYRSDGPNTALEWAQETVTITGGVQGVGPCVRMQAGASTAYCAIATNNLFRLQVWIAGTATAIELYDSTPPVTGDIIKITALGSVISVYKNGVCMAPCGTVDTQITSGFTGMLANNGALTQNGVSNFQSGTWASCNVQLDSSTDGSTWTAGGAIPNQACVTNTGNPSGSYQSTTSTKFVRVNVTALAPGQTLDVVYSGRQAPALAGTGSGSVSNGQQVQAGEIIWTQLTSQGTFGTISVTSNFRIITPNGQINYASVTIPSCVTALNGVGFGFIVPVTGALNAASTQISTGGIPQGAFYVQHFVFQTMPGGGTTNSCTNAYNNFNVESIMLDCAPTGSSYPVGFTGTTVVCISAWSIPGYTSTINVSSPAAGAEWSYTVPGLGGVGGGARTCVQSVSFSAASGSTGINPVLVFTFNSSKLVYAPATQQGAGTTHVYSFSPGAVAETVTAGSTIYHIVPFNNGVLACFNSGLTTATIGTLTTGLNGTTQYSAINLLVQIQQDND